MALILALVLMFQPALTEPQTDTSPITPPQIAAEAIQLDQRLRSSPDRLVSSEAMAYLGQEVTRIGQTAAHKATQTEKVIEHGGSLSDLQQSLGDWQDLEKQVESLSQILTRHATVVEREVQSLKTDQTRWVETNKAIQKQKPPPALLELASKSVEQISPALMSAEEQLQQIAGMQQLVATHGSMIATETEHIKKAMEHSQSSLLECDSLPLWQVQFEPETAGSKQGPLRGTYAEDLARLLAFAKARRTVLAVAAALTLAAFLFFIHLKAVTPSSTHRPVAMALLVFLIATIPLLHGAPNAAAGLLSMIGAIPVVRLLKPRLTRSRQQMLVALITTVVFWHLMKTLHISTWIERDLTALFSFVVIAVFTGLIRKSRQEDGESSTLVLVPLFAGLVLLCLAFAANLFGFVRLSDLLNQGMLTSAYRGILYYTLMLAGIQLVALTLRRREEVTSVDTDRGLLARRLTFALGAITLAAWIDMSLNAFAVRTLVYAAIGSALDYPIKIGSATFVLSNVVAFVLTLAIGYLVASVIRTILSEGILPRLSLSHGLPYAIATLTHYVVLFFVFVVAVTAAGVELSKFTILTGAVGVGLGFGLQNVVADFVSGLILLFERPVRVGDFLDVGGITGQVRKIGARSSTLNAPDGSNLIIPNSKLIAERVVNWTLTNKRRQIVLSIPVAYGTDPVPTRDLIRQTVEANQDVLSFPRPLVFFTGFGDSALNFEVRFWAPQPQAVGELRSNVALSIASALSSAGIQIPVPQRLLRITTPDQDGGLNKAA